MMDTSGENRKLVFDCVLIMLRPILKFCLRHSIKMPDLVECCKLALVELAEEQLKENNVKVSVSRLSVISGITRREVSRIRAGVTQKLEPLTLPTKIIGQWQHDKRFCRQPGEARVLESEGRDSEFAMLVRSVSRDLNPYTVLFELERIGAVKRSAEGRIELCESVYGPIKDLKQGAQMIASDVSDLMAAIEENYARAEGTPPNYHLVTEYDNIALEAVPELQRWILIQGSRFHAKVRQYFAKFDKDLNPDLAEEEGGVRFVFGGFSRVVLSRSE